MEKKSPYLVSQNSLMDHPDIVVQFHARVAPASHRDKPTSTGNSAPGIEGHKRVKKWTLESFGRRASEGNNAEPQKRPQPRSHERDPTPDRQHPGEPTGRGTPAGIRAAFKVIIRIKGAFF